MQVSVSCGHPMKPDDPASVAIKQLFEEQLNATLSEETKAYLHFNLPAHVTQDDTKMSEFFFLLESK
jgi:hypothetical protein